LYHYVIKHVDCHDWDTFEAVKDDAELEWTLAYAQIIFSIESEMPPSKLATLHPYWAEIGGKRYLQIMDTNKEYYKNQDMEEKELLELLKSMDTDQDGKISDLELKIGSLVLKSLNKINEEPDDGFRAQKDHVAVLESSENFGTTSNLSGRLQADLTAL